jgi:hypothetical protein
MKLSISITDIIMRSSGSLVILLAGLAAGRQIPQNVKSFYDTWKVR